MTKQNKNAKKRAYAKQFTDLHKQGQRGPSSNTATHGKRYTYRGNDKLMKSLAEYLKKTQGQGDTVLDKLNAAKLKLKRDEVVVD